MPRPRLDADQVAAAINAVHEQREQAVRYVLSVLDATAFNAPALPYLDVLARVHELITTELRRYASGVEEEPQDADPPEDGGEREVHHHV